MTASQAHPIVYIVDDEAGMRKSLRWLLETLDVTVEAFESAAGFLDSYDAARPGCLLLDMRMPDMSGLELQRALTEQGIDIPVIVLTGHADVPTAVDALKRGAFEFLEKPCKDDILLEHVRQALALDTSRHGSRADVTAVRERLRRLTRRESEILQLVVEGLKSKAISHRLEISTKTVEAHRAKIMQKMEAQCVAELVRLVVSTGNLADSSN